VSNNGPLAEPGSANASDPPVLATTALDYMERALDLLDQLDGADGADAHLDMAIHRLRDWIGNSASD
jgi:hypothetical protein